MCSLYSITTNQAAIIALFRVVNGYVGNLAPMPGVFPDYPAPVIRNSGGELEMTMMRWVMPPPPRAGGYPVTNIRNTLSPHWRAWLSAENRCLVPANSFAEYAPEPNPETKKNDVVWFALNEDRPLFAFAGMWTIFTCALCACNARIVSKPMPSSVISASSLPAELAILNRLNRNAAALMLPFNESSANRRSMPSNNVIRRSRPP